MAETIFKLPNREPKDFSPRFTISPNLPALAGSISVVDEGFRGRGMGSELLRRALAWLESAGATPKLVTVAHGNEEALALYKRFGFHPRTIVLQQNHDATGQSRSMDQYVSKEKGQ